MDKELLYSGKKIGIGDQEKVIYFFSQLWVHEQEIGFCGWDFNCVQKGWIFHLLPMSLSYLGVFFHLERSYWRCIGFFVREKKEGSKKGLCKLHILIVFNRCSPKKRTYKFVMWFKVLFNLSQEVNSSSIPMNWS